MQGQRLAAIPVILTLLVPAEYLRGGPGQICTASEDPQQVINLDQWLHQQGSTTGQALADAAQQVAFDPAFIALTTFPQVVSAMAQNIGSYAQIGLPYKSDQGLRSSNCVSSPMPPVRSSQA
jgi:hypothetical protein